MKIEVKMSITLDVPEEQAKNILSDDNKSNLLMTIFNGNNEKRPDLGQWYPHGEYSINDKYFGKV